MENKGNKGSGVNRVIPIYDLSFRELGVIVSKLEADNVNLRRDLHSTRVQLNEKDEEILRLRRELLEHKQESLRVTRKIMNLTEIYKLDHDEELKCLLRATEGLLSASNIARGKADSPLGSVVVEPPTLEEVKPIIRKKKAKMCEDEYKPVAVRMEDDMQHVKDPFACQYRHLRLQASPKAESVEEQYVVENGNEAATSSGYEEYCCTID